MYDVMIHLLLEDTSLSRPGVAHAIERLYQCLNSSIQSIPV